MFMALAAEWDGSSALSGVTLDFERQLWATDRARDYLDAA